MIDFSLLPSPTQQLVLCLRLLCACVCGAAIGLERSHRQKEAGIRTHMIVALGSALVMLVSKYAFFDVVINNSMQVDVSRIAANSITGISFLGAGIIFTRGFAIKGLTTAAGIWATAGIGLALGAGLYLLGFVATVLVIVIHVLLHGVYDDSAYTAQVKLSFSPEEDITAYVRDHIEQPLRCFTKGMTLRKAEDGSVHVLLDLQAVRGNTWKDSISALRDDPHVYYVEM